MKLLSKIGEIAEMAVTRDPIVYVKFYFNIVLIMGTLVLISQMIRSWDL